MHLDGFIIRTHKWTASRAWWLFLRVKLSGQCRVLFHACYENEWKVVYVQVWTESCFQLQRLVSLFKILLEVRVGISGTSVSNGQLPIAWMTRQLNMAPYWRKDDIGEPKYLEQTTIAVTVQERNLGLDLTLRKLNLWENKATNRYQTIACNVVLMRYWTILILYLEEVHLAQYVQWNRQGGSRWKFRICTYTVIILCTVFPYIHFCELKMAHSGRNMSSSAQ